AEATLGRCPVRWGSTVVAMSRPLCLYRRAWRRMIDLLQVDHGGEGAEVLEYVIGALVNGHLCYRPGGVVRIAKHDCARRTGLSTGHCELVRIEVPLLRTSPVLRLTNALYAEGALLHHTLSTNGHIGVELPVERLRESILTSIRLTVAEPVVVTNLVRAVVRAVAGSHATVVHLHVQPVRRVVRCVHREHRLARRVTAVLAEHRHEPRLEVRSVILTTLVVAP